METPFMNFGNNNQQQQQQQQGGQFQQYPQQQMNGMNYPPYQGMINSPYPQQQMNGMHYPPHQGMIMPSPYTMPQGYFYPYPPQQICCNHQHPPQLSEEEKCKLCRINKKTPGFDFCCIEHGRYFNKNFAHKSDPNRKKCIQCLSKDRNKGFDWCSKTCALEFRKHCCVVCKKKKKNSGFQTCSNRKCQQQLKNKACRYCKKSVNGGECQRKYCQRRIKLRTGTKMTLYHQTSKESATKILQSNKMLRGKDGLAGGGIYFATSAKDTEHKAHHKGVILKCTVLLGNIKTISQNGDKSINFSELLKQGYHSVKIPRNGDEYVVYNYDQVKRIRVHKTL